MKISTGYVDKTGKYIFYGDTVEVSKFNGIYNFEGKCKVEMSVRLVPIPDQENMRGFNGFGADSYLNKEAQYSLATKTEDAPQDIKEAVENIA
jgi:hypothetical protein